MDVEAGKFNPAGLAVTSSSTLPADPALPVIRAIVFFFFPKLISQFYWVKETRSTAFGTVPLTASERY
jgi:hypothetical protein